MHIVTLYILVCYINIYLYDQGSYRKLDIKVKDFSAPNHFFPGLLHSIDSNSNIAVQNSEWWKNETPTVPLKSLQNFVRYMIFKDDGKSKTFRPSNQKSTVFQEFQGLEKAVLSSTSRTFTNPDKKSNREKCTYCELCLWASETCIWTLHWVRRTSRMHSMSTLD